MGVVASLPIESMAKKKRKKKKKGKVKGPPMLLVFDAPKWWKLVVVLCWTSTTRDAFERCHQGWRR